MEMKQAVLIDHGDLAASGGIRGLQFDGARRRQRGLVAPLSGEDGGAKRRPNYRARIAE